MTGFNQAKRLEKTRGKLRDKDWQDEKNNNLSSEILILYSTVEHNIFAVVIFSLFSLIGLSANLS